MDLSFTANILGIISFLALLLGWISHLIRKLKADLAEVKEVSESGKWLAEQLLSQATNAERRSDIHTFITLKVLSIHTRRIQSHIAYSAMLVTVLILFICASVMFKYKFIYYVHPLVITILISILFLMASLARTVYFELSIRKIENGWLKGIDAALDIKVKKHTSHP